MRRMLAPFATLLLALGMSSALRAEKISLVLAGPAAGSEAPAGTTTLKDPFGVAFDRAGQPYIIEMEGGRLLHLDANGTLRTIAGQTKPGDTGDGGPASAEFNNPHSLAVLPDGRVLVADTWNGRIRIVDPVKNTIAPVPGYGVPVAQAKNNGPYSIALNSTGTKLYIADVRRIQALDLATHELTVVAGNGQKGVPTDGAIATAAPLVDPRAVAVDSKGRVYILERNGHALRVVEPDGHIRTVVNASGKKGGTGDGGDALTATMNGPKHLCIDHDDTVLIVDTENHTIRRYVPATGKILRVAGTGEKGATGLDGPPEHCALNRPHGITVGPGGTLYISDSENHRVLKIVR